MITGWGSHHLDIAHWGMGTEYTGPVEVEGQAEFPKDGLWDVHGTFHIEYTYANGVKMICADEKKVKERHPVRGRQGLDLRDARARSTPSRSRCCRRPSAPARRSST